MNKTLINKYKKNIFKNFRNFIMLNTLMYDN
jgi:hypothetical protein